MNRSVHAQSNHVTLIHSILVARTMAFYHLFESCSTKHYGMAGIGSAWQEPGRTGLATSEYMQLCKCESK